MLQCAALLQHHGKLDRHSHALYCGGGHRSAGVTSAACLFRLHPQPASGTSSATNYSLGNGNTATMGPGVYCGGITVGGAATLTLNPGTYIMNGGGFNVSNSGKVNATGGVFIYNTATGGQTAGSRFHTGIRHGESYRAELRYLSGNRIFPGPRADSTPPRSPTRAAEISPVRTTLKHAAFNFTGSTASATTAAFVASTVTVTGSSSLVNDAAGRFTGLAHTTVALMQ